MNAGDDELLGRYARHNDQAAADELIRRHIDFVYAAARRQGGDRHAAEDVTQAVFMLLLRKPRSIRRGQVAGWLFQTTRYAAANARKVLGRRARHEKEAAAQRKEEKVPEQEHALAAELDESIAALGAGERDAIVLRYLEGREIADICQILGASEAAIHKRLTRAIEKLRRLLEAKEVGAVVAVLHMAAGEKAPASLRLPGADVSGRLTGEILRATSKTLIWAKVKVAAAVLICVGTVSTIAVSVQMKVGARHQPVGDSARLVLPSPRSPSVVLVSANGNLWLEKFLDSANLRGRATITPGEYEQRIKDPQAVSRQFDVIIFDGYNPKALPQGGSFIYNGCVPPNSQIAVAKGQNGAITFKDETVRDWEHGHPMLRDLNLQFLAAQSVKLQLPPDAQMLVEGRQGPLIVLYRDGRSAHLVFAFDVRESTWPTTSSFPVFMDNALQFMAAGSQGDSRGGANRG